MSETRIPEALALLREKGWCKGRFENQDGNLCIQGALLVAYGVRPGDTLGENTREDHDAVQRIVVVQRGVRSVAQFNDHPETTFADVEFVLEKAILERGGAL